MMDEPKDAAEIIARIEAIDWQLSKPGAMALSRGWSRQEVATWAIRANDARAHLVSHLVELRSQVQREKRALEERVLFLRREKEDALTSLAAQKAENDALRNEIESLRSEASTVDARERRFVVAVGTDISNVVCDEADRVVSLTVKSIGLRVQIASARNQKIADSLRRVHKHIRLDLQQADESFARWCRERQSKVRTTGEE